MISIPLKLNDGSRLYLKLPEHTSTRTDRRTRATQPSVEKITNIFADVADDNREDYEWMSTILDAFSRGNEFSQENDNMIAHYTGLNANSVKPHVTTFVRKVQDRLEEYQEQNRNATTTPDESRVRRQLEPTFTNEQQQEAQTEMGNLENIITSEQNDEDVHTSTELPANGSVQTPAPPPSGRHVQTPTPPPSVSRHQRVTRQYLHSDTPSNPNIMDNVRSLSGQIDTIQKRYKHESQAIRKSIKKTNDVLSTSFKKMYAANKILLDRYVDNGLIQADQLQTMGGIQSALSDIRQAQTGLNNDNGEEQESDLNYTYYPYQPDEQSLQDTGKTESQYTAYTFQRVLYPSSQG